MGEPRRDDGAANDGGAGDRTQLDPAPPASVGAADRPDDRVEVSLIGTRVGKFLVTALLSQGGMAQVYAAAHPSLGNRAAIKVLSAKLARDPTVLKRFYDEARAAASIHHAGVVEIYDFDQLPDGRPYIVMEYLEGEALSQRLAREGVLDPRQTATILAAVCAAVAEAHRLGIVHRDLKPDNIFLVRRPGLPGLVKVLDFGIAKLARRTGSAASTRAGMVFGTPEYMSPEQAFGKNDLVGPASDVYSLGVIAYRMLAGCVPFPASGLSFGDLINKHAKEPPPSLRAARPDVPERVERVVLKALAKGIAQRWRTVTDFGDALVAAAGVQGAPTLIGGFGPVRPLLDPTPGGELGATPTPVDALAATTPPVGLPMEARAETTQSGEAEQVVGPAGTEAETTEPEPRAVAPRSVHRSERWPVLVACLAGALALATAALALHGRRKEAPAVPPVTRTIAPRSSRPAPALPPLSRTALPPVATSVKSAPPVPVARPSTGSRTERRWPARGAAPFDPDSLLAPR